MQEIKSKQWLRVKQVIEIIPVGESTWWRWVAKGKAPAPIKLGPKTTVWRAEDIEKFMHDQETNQAKISKSSSHGRD